MCDTREIKRNENEADTLELLTTLACISHYYKLLFSKYTAQKFDIEGLTMESGRARNGIIEANNKWMDFETQLRRRKRTTMPSHYREKAVVRVLRE